MLESPRDVPRKRRGGEGSSYHTTVVLLYLLNANCLMITNLLKMPPFILSRDGMARERKSENMSLHRDSNSRPNRERLSKLPTEQLGRPVDQVQKIADTPKLTHLRFPPRLPLKSLHLVPKPRPSKPFPPEISPGLPKHREWLVTAAVSAHGAAVLCTRDIKAHGTHMYERADKWQQ